MANDSFEKDMNRLNEIVTKLEGNELSLDEAMKLFEEGLELVDNCTKKLNSFDEKLKQVIEQHEKENEEEHE